MKNNILHHILTHVSQELFIEIVQNQNFEKINYLDIIIALKNLKEANYEDPETSIIYNY